MLRSLKELFGNKILSTDGEIGRVHDFYFDDHAWTVRYMVADTGGWLKGRLVLISPAALGEADRGARSFPVDLTRQQIEESPGIEADLPVSRQQEIELQRYYGWPAYWGGGILLSGTIGIAPQMAVPQAVREQQEMRPGERMRDQQQPGDPHLRAVREVRGYHVQAGDGEIGHLEDLIGEDESWVIRYLDVDTKNWLPGKHVLVAPQWVDTVSWDDSRVYMALRKEQIEGAPEYSPGMAINRGFERGLYQHYGRQQYWSPEKVGALTRR